MNKEKGKRRQLYIHWQSFVGMLPLFIYGPGHAKMCLMPYANNKGADQPAHPRSLISAFFVRSLDSIISLVFRSEISRV